MLNIGNMVMFVCLLWRPPVVTVQIAATAQNLEMMSTHRAAVLRGLSLRLLGFGHIPAHKTNFITFIKVWLIVNINIIIIRFPTTKKY